MFTFNLSGVRLRTRNLLAISGLAVLIGAQSLAVGPLLRWMLEEDVRSTSASWAAHVYKQIAAGVVEGESGHPDPAIGKSHANLAGAMEAALRAGVIDRAVIMNEDCDCLVEVDGASLAEPENALAERLKRFFAGEGEAVDTTHPPMSPEEWASVASTTDVGTPQILFHTENTAIASQNMAEVTFFREIAGKRYALCLFMDVTVPAARLRLMLLMGALIFTVTLAGAALFVARIASHSNRAMRLSEKQARFLAEHDPLTGLLNRFGFGVRADVLLQDCLHRKSSAILFQIDADKFKEINDIHGHATGDRVIQAIGQMLKAAFPANALVARLGGDEFAVLVPAKDLNKPLRDFAEALPTGTDVMSDDGAKLIEVSTSIGVASFPKDANGLGDLMKAADLALYSVKAAGRNAVGAYRRDMTRALERRHWELDGVRQAIRENQLIPYYQPLINARDGRIEGVEALARWCHPTYGVLPPDRFKHALEDPRVATEITQEMLRRAADDLRTWTMLGHDFSVGLNIGEADLRDGELVTLVADTLRERDLRPNAVAIEVTETALTGVNSAAARPHLERFRAAGGYIALDDFGTGNSSITLLKDIPYSSVKIDRSFIRDLTHNEADLAIVRSIVRLSRELGFKIVAEGIETKEQAQLLRKLRVDLLQGYLYSRPLPAAKLTELLDWASPPRRRARSAPDADAA
ncbi:putative bifunctional diguanylate cyclase/phosphodiesterase [Silicimonas sp. MF1-12-2]|uniref:putative bifunctional diguanylate cyclase/phosphodiesterase n=1 Tax=Silicimonas sp. MF1-12-2 TaxID=3384793 RepID=UPI0039B47590